MSLKFWNLIKNSGILGNWARFWPPYIDRWAFQTKEPQGFVTMGHNEKSMLVTNCNFKYMVDFIEE